MIFTGTLVNTLAVVIGSAIGLVFKSKIKEHYINTLFIALGVFTFSLGIGMSLKMEQPLIVVFSLVIGVLLGEWLQLDKTMDRLTKRMLPAQNNEHQHFTHGLTFAFILFCIGSMTIVGSIEEGLGQPPTLLYTKSLMDGFSSIAIAAAFGSGVLFSAIPLFVFQASITLLAYYLGDFLPQGLVTDLSAVGGLIIVALALSILKLKEIKVINFLPSLIIVVVLYTLLYLIKS